MATATWRTYRGHDWMRPPKFHPNRSIGRRVIAFPIFSNMAAVRHLEYEFCYSGLPMKSTMRFDYHVEIWYRSNIPRRRYYDFIILPLWLENAYPCPLFGVFWGFWGWRCENIVFWPPKRHYPTWIRVCWCIAWQNRFNGLSSRSVKRFLRRKKEIK